MPTGSPRRAHEINQQAVNPRFPDRIRELGLAKIICPLALRLNKALIAQCMMVRYGGRAPRLGENIMGKIASAIVAVALVTSPLALPGSARAENGQIAAGVVGGLIGGALLGGALASRPPPPPPVYYAPAPVYVEEPACRLVRERFWDGYGWQFRRVQVCD
jgi:hypothetical protein